MFSLDTSEKPIASVLFADWVRMRSKANTNRPTVLAMTMNYEEVLSKLKSLSNPDAVKGMARYGINPSNNYGVSVHSLRLIAEEVGADHKMAQQLWSSGIHDARILASMIDRFEDVTEQQMESWISDFDSWDVCDQCCNNLFSKTRYAHQKATEWSRSDREFTKRAGFVLMASLAVHDKAAGDTVFVEFLQIVEGGSRDERNYVKKAVNWALRQIGKRNVELNEMAIRTAEKLAKLDSKSARWIALDAIRELTSEKIRTRLRR
jgi:3-methyladenine DNA glycosylase AlkD